MRFRRGVLAASLLLGFLTRAESGNAQVSQAPQPPPSELNEGRQLFSEALADEEHGRYAAALEKYKRVQAIRDTVNVRYRIGASLEGLGKVARAVDAYTAAVKLGTETAAPGDAEVVRGAQARLDVLRPRTAHLAIHVTPQSFADVAVEVDSEPVTAQALDDVTVDPGPHVVTASAKGAKPFRAQITLSEGGRAGVPVVLEPLPGEASGPTSPPPTSSDRSRTYRTVGLVTAAAGGALILGGAIVLVLRGSAISKLHDSCPGGNCPASREQELTSTRDRALAFGPLGGVLLGVGAAALGTGIVLFTVAGRDAATATRIVPATTTQSAMLTVVRGF
jgi:hypothetical protein